MMAKLKEAQIHVIILQSQDTPTPHIMRAATYNEQTTEEIRFLEWAAAAGTRGWGFNILYRPNLLPRFRYC